MVLTSIRVHPPSVENALARQETKWPTNAEGQPIGNGCHPCKTLVTRLFPEKTFDQVLVLVQSKSQEGKDAMLQIKGGRAVFAALEEAAPDYMPVRFPDSEVVSSVEYGNVA